MPKKINWIHTDQVQDLIAGDIDGVIFSLGNIIEWAKLNKSKLGYFPALYCRVTVRVKEGIAAGHFENGPLVEELDVKFANRYFKALQQYLNGEPCTQAWKMSFEAAELWQPIVLQHLLIGHECPYQSRLGTGCCRGSG